MKLAFLKRAAVSLSVLVLLTLSLAAHALGLGEIRVLSQPGQPLVAEIPIISTEPGELEQLQARLAAPETFERVGLARPTGLVGGLDFYVTMSSDDRPVIRVTSDQPVQVDAVNFLIEVDWGQGRLVREYSALVSAPGTVAAASQPLIDAPLPPPSSTIIREPDPIASAQAVQPPPQPAPLPPATDAGTAAAAAPPAAASQGADPGELQVRSGQTLSGIAATLQTGASLDQTMIALLRANPEAFINGNVNLLRAGAVLRVPPSAELASLQESEATALVREQTAQWRQARQPIPQPVAATAASTPQSPAAAGAAAGSAQSQARLEIAPPAADSAAQAGTQSGIDADGEGDMLANQQLTATREDLAARESEVQELRAQVSELESLREQQSQLIQLKDSELAAAQAQLARTQGDAGQPLWMWAGLALLVAGLVVAWLLGRRTRAPARATAVAGTRPGYDSAALAAALPAQPAERFAEDLVDESPGGPAGVPAQPPAASASDGFDQGLDGEVPAVADEWSAPPSGVAVGSDEAMPPAWTTAARPTWHTSDTAGNGTGGADVASLNPAPAGRERLELAVAYLDLGDVETARDLLNEVVAGGDTRASDEASRLLRELG